MYKDQRDDKPTARNPAGGPPRLYLTSVSTATGEKPHGMMRVYRTAEQARGGHKEMVDLVRKYFTDQNEDA